MGKKNNSKETNLFEPLDFYMLRVPLVSMESYRKLFLNKDNNEGYKLKDAETKLFDFCSNPLIREVLSVSSTSLINSMDKLNGKENERKRNQVVDGLLKYTIRMSTRSTPYGLMAGVSTGGFSHRTNIELNPIETYKKRTRPDMEWVFGVIKKLEERYEVASQLKVVTNPTIVIFGDRVELPYTTKYGQQENSAFDMDNVSVRFTEAVDYTFKQAQRPIEFKKLLSNVQEHYKEAPGDKIQNFLWQLFQNEILISDLRPPLTVVSPFKYVIEKLNNVKGIENELNELKEIYRLINEYDEKALGHGEKDFKNLVKRMQELHDVKTPMQVDLAVNEKEAVVNKEVSNEIAKAAECLWKLSQKSTSKPYLESYRMDFIEKYGTSREVPVLELLDEDKGIGAPASYEFPRSKKELKRNSKTNSGDKLKEFILNEVLKSIKNNTKEIEITDKILENLDMGEVKRETAPVSLDLYSILLAKCSEDIDKGAYNLMIAANPFSYGAGKTFGRFADMLGDDFMDKLHEVNEKERKCIGDAVFAEIVYCPSRGRSANVAIAPNTRDYEVVLSTSSSKDSEHTLPLSDILIGTTMDNFYIMSKSLRKRLIITTGHMLNTSGAPNVYRFLREISMDGKRQMQPFSWDGIEEAVYLPRVRYSKTIISPAQWNLRWNLLGEEKGVSYEKFMKAVDMWREQWEVPQLVYLTLHDNKILLDLEQPLHVRLLMTEMNKPQFNQLKLVESGFGDNENFIKGELGDYISEIVVPLVRSDYKNTEHNTEMKANTEEDKNKEIEDREFRNLLKNNSLKVTDNCRMKFPGSEWLFLKLYGNSKRENELISFYIKSFCDEVISEKLADEFFFMRYTDKGPHMRLRFKGNPEILTSKLLPKVNKWSQQLFNCGLLSDISIDTYEKEVERYGGPQLIEFAETVFFYDSIAVSNIIFLERTNQLKLNLDMVCAVSIVRILEDLGWDFKKQLNWLNSVVDYKKYKEEFRKDRNLYMKLLNSEDNWSNLCSHEGGNEINNILSVRSKALEVMSEKINESKNAKALCSREENIVASLIHLHCNRMIGTDRARENKIMTLTRHALYNMRYIKEKKNGNR